MKDETPCKCKFCEAAAVENRDPRVTWLMCDYHWAEYWLIRG